MRERPAREPRLDPVRWRRPGRGVLIRLAAVTLLLGTAAALLWSRPTPCPVAAPQIAGLPVGCLTDSPSRPGTLSPAPSRRDPAKAGRGSPSPDTAGRADPPATAGQPVPVGAVGVAVRLAEPAALRLLRPGDRVDLFRVGEDSAPVATAALVLEIAGADDPTSGGLLLALTPAEAQRTVTAAGQGYAVVIRPDG